MNTFVLFLLLTLTISCAACATPLPQSSKIDPPTKLARYQVGTYLARQGTQLRVNVDKQLGGAVYVQLIDRNGRMYFERTMGALETTIRLSVDLTELADGNYLLKISNGLEIEVRDIKITTQKPTALTRSLTIL